jgi:hypothetical protein
LERECQGESLNLAYHGARAEKQGFEITLERSFDPAAGEVDLFPQEITRALLNLISNGFYAATKRKTEPKGGDYEPMLAATTQTWCSSFSSKPLSAVELAADRSIRRNASQVGE